MRLEGGQKIGERYTLIQRIGSGGMADVWVADDAMLGRRVALKFLHERFTSDEQFVERFRREATAAAGLQHPNVVAVYDRGEFEGRYFIAMEYVEGASLKDLVERGLSIPEAIEITRQILAAARFAHERGIIHRDFKPQNVLIDAEGRARVTDFGIARAGTSDITHTGSVLGTAQYLSPEQAQGMETSATSDIYSVGVILYEALTGQVPFQAETAVAVALKQVSEQPVPPNQLNPKISPALNAVVLKALAKAPADRFATADEFSRALDAAENGDGTTGVTSVAGGAMAAGVLEEDEEEESWLSRNRKAVILAVLAALIIAGIVYALTRSGEKVVPNVIGKSQAKAERILTDAGFKTFPKTFERCDKPNTVSEQSPAAGENAEEGSTIQIFISLGQSVEIPDLSGFTVNDAKKKLDHEQLSYKEEKRFSGNVKSGKLIGTDPAAGQTVECRTIVTMLVSKGPNTVAVPTVIGLDSSEASSQLAALGLSVNTETKDADEPDNQVIDVDPGQGTTVRKGSTVTLTVSTGAGSIIVPDVTGQPRQSAISTLRGRGVSQVKVVEQETTEKGEDGRVLDQAPGGGTRIRKGESVTIFVGRYKAPKPPPPPTTSTTTSSTSTTTTTTDGGP